MSTKKLLFFFIALFLPCYISPSSSSSDSTIAKIREIFQHSYNSYREANHTEGEYLIPPIIHFIWLGGPLPDKNRECIRTWEVLHPGWTIRIWRDEDVPAFGLKNQAAFDRAENFGEKSDIFRYEILYRFGGVYADTDFECIKPFDVLHKTCEFYAGAPLDSELANGLVGTRREHPIIKACIDQLMIGNGDQERSRIIQNTGPGYFRNIFLAYYSECDEKRTVVFPQTFFYPLSARKALALREVTEEATKKKILRDCVKPETFTIHHWENAWIEQSASLLLSDYSSSAKIEEIFKHSYDAYREANHTEGEYLIPPIIHFIWLGGPIPDKNREWMKTWEVFHPDWIVKVWCDEDIPPFGLKNQEAFDQATNFGEKSDIFRYEILYRFGGMYVDSDFECIKPFDVLHKTCEFYTGASQHDEVNNGLIGAKRAHPIMKACIDQMTIGSGDHDYSRILHNTGPDYLNSIFLNYYSKCDDNRTVVFPRLFFIPLGSTRLWPYEKSRWNLSRIKC